MRPVTSKDLAKATVQVRPVDGSRSIVRRALARIHPGFMLSTVTGLTTDERHDFADAGRPQTATALHEELQGSHRSFQRHELDGISVMLVGLILLVVTLILPSGFSVVTYLFGLAAVVFAWITMRRRPKADADGTIVRACLLAARELEIAVSASPNRATRLREQAARWVETASGALGTKLPGPRAPAAYRSEVRDQVRWAQRGLATIIGAVAVADPGDRHATELVVEQLLKVVSLVHSGRWVMIGDVSGPGRPVPTLTATRASPLEVVLQILAVVLALIGLAHVLT